jgi:hypothetical protein
MIDIKKVRETLFILKTSNVAGLGYGYFIEQAENENQIVQDAIDELERLQERETPKKTNKEIIKNVEIIRGVEHTVCIFQRCPVCYSNNIGNYCQQCGQKLDWSD